MKKRGIAISLMLLAMMMASCGNKDKNRQFNSFSVDDLPQLVRHDDGKLRQQGQKPSVQ